MYNIIVATTNDTTFQIMRPVFAEADIIELRFWRRQYAIDNNLEVSDVQTAYVESDLVMCFTSRSRRDEMIASKELYEAETRKLVHSGFIVPSWGDWVRQITGK